MNSTGVVYIVEYVHNLYLISVILKQAFFSTFPQNDSQCFCSQKDMNLCFTKETQIINKSMEMFISNSIKNILLISKKKNSDLNMIR